MNYSNMLSGIVDASQLSLRKISKRCSEQGVSITPSYISQLKNGKLPPPSENISLILAQVCGSKKSTQLVFQGYMEKAPTLVREYMLASSSLNKLMLESLCQKSDDLSPDFKKYIEDLDVLGSLDLSSKFVSANENNKGKDIIRELSLASGLAVNVDSTSEIMHIFVPDTSMSPTIPVHSHVYILPTKMELLKDKDVIAIYPSSSKSITLRRFFRVNGKPILIPEEKSHQVYSFNSLDEINYAGKVVSYKVDL